MKLDPGFTDHWKTRQLLDRIGAEGIVAILRLWGRAQIQRQWSRLELTPKKLKAICGFTGDETTLWEALTDKDSPWLDVDTDGTFTIHGFEEHQAQVIALWKNGRKGGRPPNKPPPTLPPPLPHPHPLPPYGSQLVQSIKPNANQMVSPVTAEDIYQAYPRKTKKPDALKAIAKAMKKCAPALLLERTKAYAAAIVWQERQFIPHPATWFNAEQFNDDPAEWQQPAPQFNATPPPGISKATADEYSPAAIVGIYPRRERTAEAADEVSRQIKAGADPAAIMAGTRAAAAEIMSQPGGHLNAYVPSTLSFFRDRRWADDPAAMFRNQAARANGAPHTKLDLGGRRPASETIID